MNYDHYRCNFYWSSHGLSDLVCNSSGLLNNSNRFCNCIVVAIASATLSVAHTCKSNNIIKKNIFFAIIIKF